MEEDLVSPEQKELEKLIVEAIERLNTEYHLYTNEIAIKIGEEVELFYKYAQGKFPKTKIGKLRRLLLKLQRLEKLEKQLGQMENDLIIIYFPDNLKKEPYSGDIRKAGATTDYKGAAGLIAYPNDSFQNEDADGIVPMNDPGADSLISCGRLIAIKKIEVIHCRSGYRYYFFDHAKQSYLRKLHIEGNGEFRLKSDNPDEFSDIILKPKEIAAAFRVLAVSYKFYE